MPGKIDARLKELDIELPEAPPAVAAYVPFTLHNGLLHIAGQLPVWNGERRYVGKIGDGLTVEDGQAAARLCALNILAQAKTALDGNLDRIVRTLKVNGFVNALDDFTAHPQVINGASEVLGSVLGDAGKHARCALGAGSLPFNVAVEVDALFAVE